ncbi:unnamed protein product [Vitrella brassicaformis CCMP3155]|uniref:Uncharacterized protein n=6 Tax=Vitrella brassicaformis TaxID=1169539 RepID=A0A0G4GYA7_VITBC|nr:unnamed protein product [Vitrella brassicaformis CCMP3155]|eukprot:CEM36106.1 unnamed protein product [Vitrella brassicaformis CCMP3155]
MGAVERQLRALIHRAATANPADPEDDPHAHINAAYTLIQEGSDSFGGGIGADVLVVFAEAAAALGHHEEQIIRALELFERSEPEDLQWNARANIVRCLYEGRKALRDKCQGDDLVEQIHFALESLTQALQIAAKSENKARYAFVVYNASLVFVEVVRPLLRPGWCKHLVEPLQSLINALNAASPAVGDVKDSKKGGGDASAASQGVPCPVDTMWRVELLLQLAFCLEDDSKAAEAQKALDEAVAKVKGFTDIQSEAPWMPLLIISARCYFCRTNANGQAALKKDVESSKWMKVATTGYLAMYGGIEKDLDTELVKTWALIDQPFEDTLKQASAAPPLTPAAHAAESKQKDIEADAAATDTPKSLSSDENIAMALLLRAAVRRQLWGIARGMAARLQRFRALPPRARVLLDMSRAELMVHRVTTERWTDAATGFLLSRSQQKEGELDERCAAVRLLEQCMTAATRIPNGYDLIEESACLLWQAAIPLCRQSHRPKIQRALQKAVDVLADLQSTLHELRTNLLFQLAKCELSKDLLSSAQSLLEKATCIDATLLPSQAPVAPPDPTAHEATEYLRPLDRYVKPLQRHLHWKLVLYEEPSEATDRAALLIDQMRASRDDGVVKTLLHRVDQVLSGELHQLMEKHQQDNPDDHEAAASPELAAKLKRVSMLMCDLAEQASAIGEHDSDLQYAGRARLLVANHNAVSRELWDASPYAATCGSLAELALPSVELSVPLDVEVAIALAEAAYTQAACLFDMLLDDWDVCPGVMEEEVDASATSRRRSVAFGGDAGEPEEPRLSPEERQKVMDMKTHLLRHIAFGVQISMDFGQQWLASNGAAHLWNFHRDVMEGELVQRAMPLLIDTLQSIHETLTGLPLAQVDSQLLMSLTTLHCRCLQHSDPPRVADAETVALAALPLLEAAQRKQLTECLSDICTSASRPVPAIPAPAGEGGGGGGPDVAGKKDAGKSRKKGRAEAASPVAAGAKGMEGEAMRIMQGIASETSPDGRMKLAQQALGLLKGMEVTQGDEEELSLHTELLARLGQHCLSIGTKDGGKLGVSAALHALGGPDECDKALTVPANASPRRLHWMGACHHIMGRALASLIDPERQEEQSILSLRQSALKHFMAACQYACASHSKRLCGSAACGLWNVAVGLLKEGQRGEAVEALQLAVSSMAAVQLKDLYEFRVNMYAALYDCYAETSNWSAIDAALDEAFRSLPTAHHRRIWALKLLSLSKQGKDVVIAMGKVKESQANVQANLWLTLAHSYPSTQHTAHMHAYQKALELLEGAQQLSAVEVRIEIADWLLRNYMAFGAARDQLQVAITSLYEIEEEGEEEEGPADAAQERKSSHSRRSSKSGVSRKSGRSVLSKRSRRSSGSSRDRRSAKSAKSLKSRRSSASISASKKSVLSRKSSKIEKAASSHHDEDAEPPNVLHSGHYEMLCRALVLASRVAPTGGEAMQFATSAVHFIVRTFEVAARQATSIERREYERLIEERQKAKKKEMLESGDKPPADAGEDSARDDNLPEVPVPHMIPSTLEDWCESGRRLLPSSIVEAVRRMQWLGDVPEGAEVILSLNNDRVFTRPSLSHYALSSLERYLFDHGLHSFALPVLQFHRHLVTQISPPDEGETDAPTATPTSTSPQTSPRDEVGAFPLGPLPPVTPLQECVSALVELRMAKAAHFCGVTDTEQQILGKVRPLLEEKISNHIETWKAAMPTMPSSFDETTGDIEVAEPPAVLTAGAEQWVCNDVQPADVLVEIADECWQRGMLRQASFFAEAAHALSPNEAARRRASVMVGRIWLAEGRHRTALQSTASGITRSPTPCAVDVTLDAVELLTDAYTQSGRGPFAEQLISQTEAALSKLTRPKPPAQERTYAPSSPAPFPPPLPAVAQSSRKAHTSAAAPVGRPPPGWPYPRAECRLLVMSIMHKLHLLAAPQSVPLSSDFVKHCSEVQEGMQQLLDCVMRGGLYWEGVQCMVRCIRAALGMVEERIEAAVWRDVGASGAVERWRFYESYLQSMLGHLDALRPAIGHLLPLSAPYLSPSADSPPTKTATKHLIDDWKAVQCHLIRRLEEAHKNQRRVRDGRMWRRVILRPAEVDESDLGGMTAEGDGENSVTKWLRATALELEKARATGKVAVSLDAAGEKKEVATKDTTSPAAFTMTSDPLISTPATRYARGHSRAEDALLSLSDTSVPTPPQASQCGVIQGSSLLLQEPSSETAPAVMRQSVWLHPVYCRVLAEKAALQLSVWRGKEARGWVQAEDEAQRPLDGKRLHVWESMSTEEIERKCMEVEDRLSKAAEMAAGSRAEEPLLPDDSSSAPVPPRLKGSVVSIGNPITEVPPGWREAAAAYHDAAIQRCLAMRLFREASLTAMHLAVEGTGNCTSAERQLSFAALTIKQSSEVCEEVLHLCRAGGAMAPDHPDMVLLERLGAMEVEWRDASTLDAWGNIERSLCQKSPLYTMLQCWQLSVPQLCNDMLPRSLMVMSLQLHDGHLYAAVAVTPPMPEQTGGGGGGKGKEAKKDSKKDAKGKAASPLPTEELPPPETRYRVYRLPLPPSLLLDRIDGLNEAAAAMRTHLVFADHVPTTTQNRTQEVLDAVDRLISPIMHFIEADFWPLGRFWQHSLSPTHLLYLPSRELRGLPFEQLACVKGMFGHNVTRDFSLHLFVHRMTMPLLQSNHEEAITAFQTAMRSSTVETLTMPETQVERNKVTLVSDPYNEDTLNTDGETLIDTHKRIVQSENLSSPLHFTGDTYTPSRDDFNRILMESSGLVYTGFGRVLSAFGGSKVAGNLHLGHMKMVALLVMASNDAAVRRQTKSDSTKTLAELKTDQAHATALLLSFRGVRSVLSVISPVPTLLIQKAADSLVTSMAKNKEPVFAARKSLLQHEVPVVERYQRIGQTEAAQLPPDMAEAPQGDDSGSEGEKTALLFDAYSASSLVCYGLPWVRVAVGEATGKGGAGKGKK